MNQEWLHLGSYWAYGAIGLALFFWLTDKGGNALNNWSKSRKRKPENKQTFQQVRRVIDA